MFHCEPISSVPKSISLAPKQKCISLFLSSQTNCLGSAQVDQRPIQQSPDIPQNVLMDSPYALVVPFDKIQIGTDCFKQIHRGFKTIPVKEFHYLWFGNTGWATCNPQKSHFAVQRQSVNALPDQVRVQFFPQTECDGQSTNHDKQWRGELVSQEDPQQVTDTHGCLNPRNPVQEANRSDCRSASNQRRMLELSPWHSASVSLCTTLNRIVLGTSLSCYDTCRETVFRIRHVHQGRRAHHVRTQGRNTQTRGRVPQAGGTQSQQTRTKAQGQAPPLFPRPCRRSLEGFFRPALLTDQIGVGQALATICDTATAKRSASFNPLPMRLL